MIVSEKIKKIFSDNNMFFHWTGIPDVGHSIDSPISFEIEENVVINGNLIPKKFGFMSYTNSRLHYGCEIGRYCSIASNVRIMGASHPVNLFTSNPVAYNKNHPLLISLLEKNRFDDNYNIIPFDEYQKPFTVGNDVWIGEDVMISHGVHIGNGAVIAARSVVTKDVPPYAIVAGSPAVVKKYRFNENIINDLTKINWWNYNILDFNDCFNKNINFFIERFNEKKSLNLIRKAFIKSFTEKDVNTLST